MGAQRGRDASRVHEHARQTVTKNGTAFYACADYEFGACGCNMPWIAVDCLTAHVRTLPEYRLQLGPYGTGIRILETAFKLAQGRHGTCCQVWGSRSLVYLSRRGRELSNGVCYRTHKQSRLLVTRRPEGRISSTGMRCPCRAPGEPVGLPTIE